MHKTLLSLSLLACCTVNAAITINLWNESIDGQNGVMLSFSGSVNTTELDYQFTGMGLGIIRLENATLSSTNSQMAVDQYTGLTGPASLGTAVFYGTYLHGVPFAIALGSSIELPQGYISGDTISGQSFFAGASVADMDFEIGDTFEWTWGAGDNADKVVLQVVPEPSTVALLSAGAAALLAVSIRRRRNKA